MILQSRKNTQPNFPLVALSLFNYYLTWQHTRLSKIISCFVSPALSEDANTEPVQSFLVDN